MLVAVLCGCGGSSDEPSSNGEQDGRSNGDGFGGNSSNNGSGDGSEEPPPEVEEFLVQSVAATASFVFVPNSADQGTTVARINGRDLSVTPIPVGLKPTDVVAYDTADQGAVAFALVEGTSSVAVIRAEAPADDPSELVRLLPVPSEVNALVACGDGRHVLAYIDPDRPFSDSSSVASLQAAALLRLGATPEEDAAFELSLTRLIREVEIVDEGRELFVVGREGVNRLRVEEVEADTFVPPLRLDLEADVFPPTDLEVEVASDASFLVVRSIVSTGLALYSLGADAVSEPVVIELGAHPTDIDLFVDGSSRRVLATMRDASSFALLDVDAALAAEPGAYVPEVISVEGANAGLAQLTPDLGTALLYSTVPRLPTMGVYDFETEQVRAYPLRNAIRSVATSPDSATAVILHDVRGDPETYFQANHGLTVFDIATGYRRPVTLQAEPVQTVMAAGESGGMYIFVMLESASVDRQGLMRVDLQTYRTDFVPLARPPRQIGMVAGQIFVAQKADTGRITFLNADTLVQRTVSGYELNAGID